jgi:hypothetical protein
MTIADLRVGDLLAFNATAADHFATNDDLGIVLDILPYLHSDDPCEVLIYWQDEPPRNQFHPAEQVDGWFNCGLVEVISEGR